MLSRAADATYWVGRYIERAESLARFIDEVAFQTEPIRLHLTEDFREATQAFAEKRKPNRFNGR